MTGTSLAVARVARRVRIDAASAAATVVGVAAFVLYARTLLPGVSFGDWAEMQTAPARLDVPHPTGYPLYVLLGKLWTVVVPVGSIAWRLNLFAAACTALAVALMVLVAVRLGVRPAIAAIAGLTMAVAGTVWSEATVAEVNALHLALVALLVWLLLRWRDERRSGDLLLGALVAGLAVSNHLLALGVDAVVVPAALWLGWRELNRRPVLLPASAGLFVAGLLPYLFIPLRAALGPPEVYGGLTTFEGFAHLVTGREFRTEMHFFTWDSLAAAWRAVPDLVAYAVRESHAAVVPPAIAGAVALWRRDRVGAVVTLGIFGATFYLFVNYVGDLSHYLLAAWLVAAIWLAVAAEWVVRRLPPRLARAELLLLILPLAVLAANFARYDRSGDRTGERFVDEVFGLLPADAVLYTYWDVAATLNYAQGVEGVRPDVAVFAPVGAGPFRPCHPTPGGDPIGWGRPVLATTIHEQEYDATGLRARYRFTEVARLRLPYGGRDVAHERPLFMLVPLDETP